MNVWRSGRTLAEDELGVRLRIVLRHPLGEADKLGVRLVLSNTRLEPAHDRRTDARRIAARLERKFVVKRHPKLFVLREFKIRWHDANDGGGFAVNPDRLANNERVAIEIALPDFVPEDCHLFRPWLVIVGRKIATKDWFHVDDLEEIFRHITAGVALGSFLVGQIDRRAVEIRAHHRERFLARAQVFVILRGKDIAVAEVVVLVRRLWIDQADVHELFRMGKGKAAEHDRVDHRKLGRDAADAEREHDDGENKEGLVLHQHAQTDAEILKE